MFSFNARQFYRSVLIATQVALSLGIILGGFPWVALAQEYDPPNRGLPGRREGGGTRGCWTGQDSASDRTLTALVPSQNFGYTLAAYPTFFVYIPPAYAQQAAAAEFALVDDKGNEVYKATFQTTANTSIVELGLPETINLPPLEVGKDYYWSFSLVCDLSDRSADLVVDSWIQRIEPTPEQARAIESATPEELPALYAQEGIWYDALHSLADNRTQLGNSVAASQWNQLLGSVGLDQITLDVAVQAPDTTQPEMP
jgi:Domain of Unknown Function (DUF928)